ncbi:cornifelin homolog A-like [Xyrichtys novacula]|uniref:Cornifelin homolog A-like n=1 Tax=Xyrichtys novacula TaxID=13765 RepID=A0AAV1HKT1_XYRNO|nr:cornifelin homolog A-like [Xyrichtys novacula]
MSEKMVVNQPRPFITTSISNEWTSGIFDCLQDLPQCCFAFWCLPCFTCKTARDAGECLCLPLLDAFGVIPPMTTALRVSVRQRYGIENTEPGGTEPSQSPASLTPTGTQKLH